MVFSDLFKMRKLREKPEHGPKILFFSGGTALKDLCQQLIQYTHNSIHLITPFDSGGSSAELRRAFHMPAVGDIRNRLLALTEKTLSKDKEIFELFSHRFPLQESPQRMVQELELMAEGLHDLTRSIPAKLRNIICHHLWFFRKNMPWDFDLRGASVGNLILTAGYLEYGQKLDLVVKFYSKLIQSKGIVRPIINESLHLVAELEDGRKIIGQHRITQKEELLSTKIEQVYLTKDTDSMQKDHVQIGEEISKTIQDADLICYPMGSFFTSVLANLLPEGVGQAVGKASCPKVFIPNTYHDPETYGLDLEEQIQKLLMQLKRDGEGGRGSDFMNFVLMDEASSRYRGKIDKSKLARWGIEVIPYVIVTSASEPYIDPEKLIECLLSLT